MLEKASTGEHVTCFNGEKTVRERVMVISRSALHQGSSASWRYIYSELERKCSQKIPVSYEWAPIPRPSHSNNMGLPATAMYAMPAR
jgi:hypothetical protein